MNFILAFIFGGLICLIGQLLMDKLKLLPVYITIIFVFLGSILELLGIYDQLIEAGHAAFLVPISSFGRSVTNAAIEGIKNKDSLADSDVVSGATETGVYVVESINAAIAHYGRVK